MNNPIQDGTLTGRVRGRLQKRIEKKYPLFAHEFTSAAIRKDPEYYGELKRYEDFAY